MLYFINKTKYTNLDLTDNKQQESGANVYNEIFIISTADKYYKDNEMKNDIIDGIFHTNRE